jgi:hypothetical protein
VLHKDKDISILILCLTNGEFLISECVDGKVMEDDEQSWTDVVFLNNPSKLVVSPTFDTGINYRLYLTDWLPFSKETPAYLPKNLIMLVTKPDESVLSAYSERLFSLSKRELMWEESEEFSKNEDPNSSKNHVADFSKTEKNEEKPGSEKININDQLSDKNSEQLIDLLTKLERKVIN